MRYNHEELQGMIPDYLTGHLPEGVRIDLQIHLRECQDCSEELALLSELRSVEVPDPGDLYWSTLPGKVSRMAVSPQGRVFPGRWSLKPVPVFLTVMIFTVAVLSSVYLLGGRDVHFDPFFEEPLAFSVLDIDGLSEDDMPLIIEETVDDTLEEYGIAENGSYSYHMEIAYLDEEEIENFLTRWKMMKERRDK